MFAASNGCRFRYLVCAKRGDIAYIIVNRPDALNAIDAPMRIDLCRAFKAARDDRDIRGIVLSGAGGEAFIGPDLGGPPDQEGFAAVESSRMMQTLLSLIETLGKPVAAAIKGVVLGCGCEIAMACTLRIATDTARFGLSENRGWPIEDETLDAYDAYDIGLVDEIVPPAELIGRAAAVVRQVATSPPAAARYASEAASRGLGARFAKPVSTRAGIADEDASRPRSRSASAGHSLITIGPSPAAPPEPHPREHSTSRKGRRPRGQRRSGARFE